MSKIKTVIVTNVPAPYRVPVWRKVAQMGNISLDVVFCAKPHIDTATQLTDYGFDFHFLSGRYFARERRFLHFDSGIWRLLNCLQPDVVITTGYIPTFLLAFFWAIRHGVPHIAMTDGTLNSEKTLTPVHRILRRMVFSHSAAFVGACEGSRLLFRYYGVDERRIHLSCLCTDNSKFNVDIPSAEVDFIFCGRFIAHKRPLFVVDVAREVAIRLGRRISVDFVGSGEMESRLRAYAAENAKYVQCRLHGYATQDELPRRYAAAKVFLFPSEWDPWGVVANEACASGLPVIVSPYAGVASELVIDGVNGFVRELDVGQWVDAAVYLLSDNERYAQFSRNSRESVAKYTYDNSASGIVSAIEQGTGFS